MCVQEAIEGIEEEDVKNVRAVDRLRALIICKYREQKNLQRGLY